MAYLIITHLSGSKSNQKEKFPTEGLQTITMGRDPSSDIAYDPEMDDIVSREHAKIEPNPSNPFELTLTDLNSSNGVFVNKIKVHGSIMIHHGDLVQLGRNGPEFRFEIDPPPPETIKSTRMAEIPKEFIPKTREATIPSPSSFDSAAGVSGTGPTADVSPKSSIGRETVERLIVSNKKESRKFAINVMAAVLGVVALVAAIFIYFNHANDPKQQLDDVAHRMDDFKKRQDQISPIVDSIIDKKTPRDIADAYSAATVYIEVSWKLIDTRSGKQLYHRYKTIGKDKYGNRISKPCYLQMQNGTVEPWLITEDEGNSNEPIGGTHTGSGFVVTENGFIVTNRHVAANWLARNLRPLPGLLYRADSVNTDGPIPTPKESNFFDRYIGGLEKWVPAKSIQFDGRDYRAKWIEGRLDTLNVTFPKNTSRISAKLDRISNKHDVALITINTAQALRKVELFDNYERIRPGDPITIMGYPGVSPETLTATKSQDPFNENPDIVTVPDPTVTPGIIGKVFRGNATPVPDEKNIEYYSEIKDSYQLTATATGAGNSGGPVFDESGRVIGIFYAGAGGQGDARVTFALPIRYAMELLTVNKPVFE